MLYEVITIIAYSDNLLGSAPIYSFFRLLGLDQFNAYQGWVVVLSILNYSFAYLFISKISNNKYAAVIGAMVFAFSIALQSQITHVQTFPRFPIPLAFLMAVYFFETLKPVITSYSIHYTKLYEYESSTGYVLLRSHHARSY